MGKGRLEANIFGRNCWSQASLFPSRETIIAVGDWDRLGTSLEQVGTGLEQAWNKLGTGWNRLGTGLEQAWSRLEQAWNRLGTGWNMLGTRTPGLEQAWNRLGAGWNRLGTSLEQVGTCLEQAWNNLGTRTPGLEQAWSRLEQAWNRLGTGWNRLGTGLQLWLQQLWSSFIWTIRSFVRVVQKSAVECTNYANSRAQVPGFLNRFLCHDRYDDIISIMAEKAAKKAAANAQKAEKSQGL